MEDVILHGSNPVQNFRPTEPGEPQFVSESPVDTLWQRSPLVEQDLRSSAQICEEGLKSHRGATDRQVRLIHAVRGHILLREVNTVPPGVDGHILPEVCELQCRTDFVGERRSVFVCVIKEMEYNATDRIRRTAGISEEIIPGLVTVLQHVLAKRR